jgi:hypothetical protein
MSFKKNDSKIEIEQSISTLFKEKEVDDLTNTELITAISDAMPKILNKYLNETLKGAQQKP